MEDQKQSKIIDITLGSGSLPIGHVPNSDGTGANQAKKISADFGGYSFSLPEIDPITMKPKPEFLLDQFYIALAYMNNPKVNEVLSAYGIRISDLNDKLLFPRSDT